MNEFSSYREGDRRDFLRWLGGGALALTGCALTGCGGGSSPTSSSASGRFVDGTVVLPTGSPLSANNLISRTLLGVPGKIQTDGKFRTDVSKTTGQMVFVTDAQSRHVYSGVTFPPTGATPELLQIDSLSTAVVFIMLSPGICPTTDPTIVRQAYNAIKTQAEVINLAATIDTMVAANGFIDVTVPTAREREPISRAMERCL